ncbi:hypothetical protein ACYFX5_25645 [Bremerella sp. T1]|nr:hypothetical protein [Bremerella volcania]
MSTLPKGNPENRSNDITTFGMSCEVVLLTPLVALLFKRFFGKP